MQTPAFPPFRPSFWLRSPHAQTYLATRITGRWSLAATRRHEVHLSDGDRLALHEDLPAPELDAGRAALLIHGLGGSHASPYMVRIAAKLVARGLRVFRLDLRGCGAGMALARRPYHAGLTDDIAAAVARVTELAPDSSLGIAGFSLGGNMLLKWLGDLGDVAPPGVDRAMAICPPVDLATCSVQLSRSIGRWYDQFFVHMLCKRLAERDRERPDAVTRAFPRRPRRLREFDDWFTAPIGGFDGVDDYYSRCSAAPVLRQIRVPTWILAAADDPVVDHPSLVAAARSPHVALTVTDRGGHMGYLARPGSDPDRHWMDWRCIDWLAGDANIKRASFADSDAALLARS